MSPLGPIRRFHVPRTFAAVMAVGLAVGALGTARLFVWPVGDGADSVRGADAVVMFVGGRGERLDTALEVVRVAGVPNLVIPNGTTPEWRQANRLCAEPQEFKVWCPTPKPDTTRGEARTIAAIARDQRWERLVLVTSEYHASRARLLLSRCFEGKSDVVLAPSRLGVLARTTRIVHEWLGFARAQVIDRAC